MRLTLLAAILAALTMTACGRPNQALPEQEKANFEKITGKSAATEPAPADDAAPDSNAPSDTDAKDNE